MRLYLKKERIGVNAVAEYDMDKRTFTVLKESKISDDISLASTFRSANSVKKWRTEYVIKNKLINDITFQSPSTAANFVTGRSTNGLVAWKNEKGQILRELLNESKIDEDNE